MVFRGFLAHGMYGLMGTSFTAQDVLAKLNSGEQLDGLPAKIRAFLRDYFSGGQPVIMADMVRDALEPVVGYDEGDAAPGDLAFARSGGTYTITITGCGE